MEKFTIKINSVDGYTDLGQIVIDAVSYEAANKIARMLFPDDNWIVYVGIM